MRFPSLPFVHTQHTQVNTFIDATWGATNKAEKAEFEKAEAAQKAEDEAKAKEAAKEEPAAEEDDEE